MIRWGGRHIGIVKALQIFHGVREALHRRFVILKGEMAQTIVDETSGGSVNDEGRAGQAVGQNAVGICNGVGLCTVASRFDTGPILLS